jgi:hypothetical protein
MTPLILSSELLAAEFQRSHPTLAPIGTRVGAGQSYAERITVGKPGRCANTPVLTISLFDNSASVTGGNDPIGQRFLETHVAISKVGARCRCGRDLAATIHFDTPTSGDLRPTQIGKAHRDEIAASLAIPPDGAGISCLGPSLTAARAIADEYKRSHRIVLAVLTDFELFDDYLDELISFPAEIHAIALRSAPPQVLLDAPRVTVTPIDHDSRPGAVARVLFCAMTRTREGARALSVEKLLHTTRRSEMQFP